MTRHVLPPDILDILGKLEPRIRSAFLKAIARLRGAASLGRLEIAIRKRDFDEAMAALGANQDQLQELRAALAEAFTAGGQYAAASLPPLTDPYGSAVNFFFDGRHLRAEAWVARESGALITGIIEDQRQAVRLAIEGGIASGRNPRDVALDIVGRINPVTRSRSGALVGLNEPQAGAVARARQELQAGTPASLQAYLERGRRDRRFDAAVRRAINTGQPLSRQQVDRITGRYADRLLALRGETIARTESLNALRAGQREGYLQLRDTGAVRDEQFERTWLSSGNDGRTRESHLAMSGQKRTGMTEPYEAPDGSRLLYPGDSSLGASTAQTIQCRCYEQVKVNKTAPKSNGFPTQEDSTALANQLQESYAFIDTAPDDQRNALRYYMRGSFTDFMAQVRTGDPAAKARVDSLVRLIRTRPLTEAPFLYRGLKEAPDLGRLAEDPFFSTAITPAKAASFGAHLLEIERPSGGFSAVYAERYWNSEKAKAARRRNPLAGEQEVLLEGGVFQHVSTRLAEINGRQVTVHRVRKASP